jgi:hypothetical protein
MAYPRINFYGRASETIKPLIQHLLDDPQAIKSRPNTRMCEIMDRNGSNKNHRQHVFYTPFYDAMFAAVDPGFVMEFGIGSQNPHMPFNMGGQPTTPGGSLRGWREAFPGAMVFGADIDEDVLFSDERIRTYHVNAMDPDIISKMWERIRIDIPDDARFQIIVDDAYHEFTANKNLFDGSVDMLSTGGFYVIEDIDQNDRNLDVFDRWLSTIGMDSMLMEIPNPTNTTNCCFAVIRGPGADHASTPIDDRG